MQAIKFMFVDILKSKIQIMVLLFIAIVQLWMMSMNSSPFNAVYYMFFGAVIVSIQPFIQEQTAEVGFINMLPGTRKNRVIGRFLFALFNNVFGLVISLINLSIYSFLSHKSPKYVWEGILLCISISLIFCSLQYILFYALGKMKSQQLAGIVMIIPGFVMFFGVNLMIVFMSKHGIVTSQWISNHMNSIAIVLFLFSIVFYVFGIQASTMIAKKKDYI